MTKQKISKQERFWLTMAFITSATVSCAGVYVIYHYVAKIMDLI